MIPVQSIAKPFTLHMHGEMKEKFGGSYNLCVHTPAEALRLMEANFPQQFFRYIRDGHFHVVRGKSLESGLSVAPDTPDDVVVKWMQMRAQHIHIVPALEGASSKGTWMTVAGGVLIAAAVFAAAALAVPGGGVLAFGAAIPGTAGFLTAGTVGSIGLGLAAGGIAMLLAKAKQTDPGHITGGLFGAPTNTAAQGVPVPICYGRVKRAGSVAISSYTSLKKVDLA